MRLIMKVSFSNWDASYCESFPIVYSSASEWLDDLEYAWINANDKNKAMQLKHAKDYRDWEYKTGRKTNPPTHPTFIDHVLVGDNKIPLNLITDETTEEFAAPTMYTVDEFFEKYSLSYIN